MQRIYIFRKMNQKHEAELVIDKKPDNFFEMINHNLDEKNSGLKSEICCKLILFIPQLLLGVAYTYGV